MAGDDIGYSMSQNLRHFFKCKPVSARPQGSCIPIANIRNHVYLEASIGEKGLVNQISLEACNHTDVQSERTCSQDQVAALQATVAYHRRFDKRRIILEQLTCVRRNCQCRQMLEETGVVRQDYVKRRVQGLVAVARRKSWCKLFLGLRRLEEKVT